MAPMRVALVHDWLVAERGGEQVLSRLCHLFPQADIFTLVYDPSKIGQPIAAHRVTESIIGRLAYPRGRFRHLLPLFGWAIERLDLSAYDIVISTSHCVAHGARTTASQLHVAYIHTPMRYLYDQLPHYLPRALRRLGERPVRMATLPLRRWDRRAAQRPDVLVANSHFVAERIARVWQRSSEVIYPPVDITEPLRAGQAAQARNAERKGLVFVGALVPYKRADLAVALARELRVPLSVVGRGSEEKALRKSAPPWVRFVSGVTRRELCELLAQSEAMVFPGEEDFGIAPVEAMAAGVPVLGVNHGGLRETVVTSGPGQTGVLCAEPSVPALADGYRALVGLRRAGALAASVLRAQAQHFARERFDRSFAQLIERLSERAHKAGESSAALSRALR